MQAENPKTESPDINVLVIGAGGVGVITTVALTRANKCNVHLVIRSDYKIVKERGYDINSCDYGHLVNWKPNYFYNNITNACASNIFFDYIVVTTKNIPDGPKEVTVPAIISPLVQSNYGLDPNKNMNIVLIQNGIDIEKEIFTRFNDPKLKLSVLSGIQLIGSSRIAPGVINQVGQDQLSIGSFKSSDKVANNAAQKFVEIYENPNINHVEFDPRVRFSRWKKLLYNSVLSTISTVVDLDTSHCFTLSSKEFDTEKTLFRPAMHEIIDIAQSENIIIDEQIIEFFINGSKTMDYKPSMCLDKEKNQLMELEVTLGNPLKIAKKNGINTPILNLVYTLLYLEQSKIKQKKDSL
ncbi:hypothetical protein TBLA_0F02220 [Henningerozyma blattae CBS 6284]|uniref:2-dehydropantoate 2-reductase n=1 Tax=Henningerozyma blattae (strain ATCC 34711 / CBS 6284 / DSM 70876 / NBRC 10599 / NRRL Y-10934 / UCD 77-7) TaxID=1071380 RepID=I2H5W2_HENB6|nr:hypothetical protein TBLA_0F02220 [Tetrapisispora blattae CBS 6284]CCH61764.1 hypothetical protein TBLA_0F02220 [Tetrapisispora blattae CBS 6284]